MDPSDPRTEVLDGCIPEALSPRRTVQRITRPTFLVQNLNDPLLTVTESEQMVRALRENETTVWSFMARDEGHGFDKKPKADFQFPATGIFPREHLLR
jgi:dipeptidyl aminopeptidase/acylaminoacyl peptidase